MTGQRIGVVFRFFSNDSVAAIRIEAGTLQVGDKIRILGATTNFDMTIVSMQMSNAEVREAHTGQEIGLKTTGKARPNDIVYKIAE